MRRLNSLIIMAADRTAVVAGSALAVDRTQFAREVEAQLQRQNNFTLNRIEVTKIPQDSLTIIATGPLTSDAMAQEITQMLDSSYLYFYDAIAPIIEAGSINMDKVFWASRYDKGTPDYLNCPLSKEEYDNFRQELLTGEKVNLVVYRKGKRKTFSTAFDQTSLPTVRKVYPAYEKIDYEVFGGMVVMELTLNHVHGLADVAPGLVKYANLSTQSKAILLITHIFPTSHVARLRSLAVGSTIHEVNGKEVFTLTDFRAAVRAGSSEKFLTMRLADNASRVTDNIFVSLPYKKIAEQEAELVRVYMYPLTPLSQEIAEKLVVKEIPELDAKNSDPVVQTSVSSAFDTPVADTKAAVKLESVDGTEKVAVKTKK